MAANEGTAVRVSRPRPDAVLPGFTGPRLIWVFVGSYLVIGTIWGVETVLFPTYALALGANTAQVGLVQAALGLGLIVAAVPAGLLVDRCGGRVLYVLGAFGMPLVYLSMAATRSPSLLVLSGTAASALATLTMVATNSAFYAHLDELGRGRTGWYKGTLSIGLSLTGPLGGGLLIAWLGYRPTFWVIAAAWLPPGLLALYSLRTGRPSRARTGGRETAGPLRVEVVRKVHAVLASRGLFGATVTEGVGIAALTVSTSFIAALVVRSLGGTAQDVGLALALEGIGYGGLMFLGGGLLRLFDRRALLVAGFVASAAGFGTFAVSGGTVPVGIGSAVLGAGLGVLGLTNIASLADVDLDKGTVAGVHGLSMGVFSFVAPVLAGLLGRAWGLRAMFATVAGAFAVWVLAVGAARVHPPRRGRRRPAADPAELPTTDGRLVCVEGRSG